MRLIDADELIKRITTESDEIATVYGGYYDVGKHNGLELAKAMVLNAPTIDAEPVKHGEWQVDWISKLDTHTGEYWEDMYYRCNACDRVCDVDYQYCPNCGAKMDLEVET